jgi:hypothetical protein
MFVLAGFSVGCGGGKASQAHEHSDGDAHAAGVASASFKEGRGLQLAPETAAALGVKPLAIEERRMAHVIALTASVFDAGPPARALTLVPPEVADAIEKNPPGEAKLLSVRRDVSSALTQVEVVLGLPGAPPLGATLEVKLRGPERTVLAVPQSALLRTAMGSFAYVENGRHLLRTAVKTGASDDRFVEIVDGLYAGDMVATEAVEQLWLTELRLTKGGGHSH